MVLYGVKNGISLVQISRPPLNGLSLSVRSGLMKCLRQAKLDKSVAVVLFGKGPSFSHGNDAIDGIKGTALNSPDMYEITNEIENFDVPVIAAMHGNVFGSGFELALGCHWRIGSKDVKFGFPLIDHGVIPGGGITQRLPRLIKPSSAIQLLISGAPINAFQSIEGNILDEILDTTLHNEESLVNAAMEFALSPKVLETSENRKISSRAVVEDSSFLVHFQHYFNKFPHLHAQRGVIACVKAAVESSSFEKGVALEKKVHDEVLAGSQFKALQYFYFGEMSASKLFDHEAGVIPHLPLLSKISIDEEGHKNCKKVWKMLENHVVMRQGISGSRMIDSMLVESLNLLLEGVSLEWIDEAWKKSIGWTHGPLELIDIMGLSTLNSSSPQDDVEAKVFAFIDRLKEKNVSKIYCSDSYSSLSTEFQAIVLECVQQPSKPVEKVEIVGRCFYSSVNEGFRMIEEGEGKIHSKWLDIAYVYGLGFPKYRGGFMWWAEREEGLAQVAIGLATASSAHPKRKSYQLCKILHDTLTSSAILQEELFFVKGKK